MRCDKCKQWKRNDGGPNYTSKYGICEGLPNDRFEVDIYAGWEGGIVNYIETQDDFFCAEYDKEG